MSSSLPGRRFFWRPSNGALFERAQHVVQTKPHGAIPKDEAGDNAGLFPRPNRALYSPRAVANSGTSINAPPPRRATYFALLNFRFAPCEQQGAVNGVASRHLTLWKSRPQEKQ